MATQPGFILTRHWQDTDSGTQLSFWIATDAGSFQIRPKPQIPVAFIPAEQEAQANSKRYQVSMNNEKIWQDGVRNIGEVKIGLQANINETTSLWFNVGHQFGSHTYHDTDVLVGARLSF